jgi:hypothetical protein
VRDAEVAVAETDKSAVDLVVQDPRCARQQVPEFVLWRY